jgi:hypothetical protein
MPRSDLDLENTVFWGKKAQDLEQSTDPKTGIKTVGETPKNTKKNRAQIVSWIPQKHNEKSSLS